MVYLFKMVIYLLTMMFDPLKMGGSFHGLPVKNGDLPIKNGDLSINNGDLPINNCDFSIKNGHFPWFTY